MTDYIRQFYEQDGIRDEDAAAQARLNATLGLIPSSIGSILDAGCGTGLHLAGIRPGVRKVGFDLSLTGLGKSAGGFPRIVASVSEIPIAQYSVDLVLCTEVLEHLSEDDFIRARKALAQVGKQFILISVPFCEDLERRMIRCQACGKIYHMHYHVRRFGMNSFENLFEGFRMKDYKLSGPPECNFPNWIVRLRHAAGRWEWDSNAMCPRCGTRNAKPRRTPVSILTSLVGSALGKRNPKWISVLFERAAGQ